MKHLLNVLFLLLSFTSCAQASGLKGHIEFSMYRIEFQGVSVYLQSEGKLIDSCISDSAGNYELKDIHAGTYTLRLKYRDFKEKIIPNVVITTGIKELNILYPDPCVPAEKRCAYNHTDSIIPIVYGMPGAETMKMA